MITTIDIECDTSSRITRECFDSPYRDNESRMWCCTITNLENDIINRKTFVCKLPNVSREFKDKYGNIRNTGVYHQDYITVEGFNNIIEFDTSNYKEYLQAISDEIRSKDKIYFKGFKSFINGKYVYDDYDKEMLTSIFTRNGVTFDVSNMVNVYNEFQNLVIDQSSKQVQSGTWKPPQIYFNDGIRHNIQDCNKLARAIRLTLDNSFYS